MLKEVLHMATSKSHMISLNIPKLKYSNPLAKSPPSSPDSPLSQARKAQQIPQEIPEVSPSNSTPSKEIGI
jgi:hypothetical protein